MGCVKSPGRCSRESGECARGDDRRQEARLRLPRQRRCSDSWRRILKTDGRQGVDASVTGTSGLRGRDSRRSGRPLVIGTQVSTLNGTVAARWRGRSRHACTRHWPCRWSIRPFHSLSSRRVRSGNKRVEGIRPSTGTPPPTSGALKIIGERNRSSSKSSLLGRSRSRTD